MHVPLSICSSDSSRCIPEYDLPCTKDGDRRSRNNFTRAVARKFTRSRHSYGRRGSERACAGGRRGRRTLRGERGTEGPLGRRRPGETMMFNIRALYRCGLRKTGRGRAGPGGPGPGGAEEWAAGRDRAWMGGTGPGWDYWDRPIFATPGLDPGRPGPLGPPGPPCAPNPHVTALSVLSFATCPQSAHSADSEGVSVVQFAEQR